MALKVPFVSAGIMQVEHTADCFGGAWFMSPLLVSSPKMSGQVYATD